MKWRTLLTVLLGLSLPLPLVWLLHTTLFGQAGEEHSTLSQSQSPRILPMLTLEERLGLPTYERDCDSDADCDPQLRCFFNMRTVRSYCTDSMCMTDRQCPEGFACRIMDTQSGEDLLRACSLVGGRSEGEVCESLPREPEDGCRKDLLCRGRCGRPCSPHEPADCPKGYFCEEAPEGPTCQPTCEGRSCPEGQQCVHRGERVSICARVHGPNCQQTPCPQGQFCSVDDYPQRVDEVWMQCLQPCGSPGDRSCPEGTVCYFYGCRKSCTPEDSSACGAGFTCKRRPEEPWTCVPDLRSGRGD